MASKVMWQWEFSGRHSVFEYGELKAGKKDLWNLNWEEAKCVDDRV